MSKKVKEYTRIRTYNWTIFKAVLVFPIGVLFVLGFIAGLLSQDIKSITTITIVCLVMIFIAYVLSAMFSHTDVYKEIKR